MEISVTMSYAVMAMSTITCFLLNALLDKLPIPPKYAEKSRRHRWRNVVVAAIHAVSGTIGGFASLYLNPELLEDHLNAFSSTMIISMAISNGYYVYDFVDIATNMKLKECLPLMVHHIMGTGILSWVLIHRKTIGIMAISSCIEFNGIFLHLRHILLMWDFKKDHIVFRINNAFNFVTYVVFRLGIFVYDSWWLCANRADVAWFLPPMAVILLLLNTGLFYRLIMSDIFRTPATQKPNKADIMAG